MKITMITHDTKIDRRILLEANTLYNAGNEVRIIAFPWDGSEDNEYSNIKISRSVVQNVARKNYPNIYKIYRILKGIFPKNLILRIRKKFDSSVLDYEKHFESFLLNLALEESADVYHVHDLPGLSTAYKVAKKYNSLLVYDSHEIFCEQGFNNKEKAKWQEIETKYINKTDAIITINESAANYLVENYNCKKPVVIMNKTKSVDQDSITKDDILLLKNQLNIPIDKKIVLYQGGFSKDRNLDNLITAMSEVNEDTILVLVGSGSYRINLEQIVSKLGIYNKVYFIDEVSQHELFKYTSMGDIGIIPYIGNCLNNYYCTPNKMFEFIAVGIPMLANDLPEIKKVIEKEKIGICTDFSNYKSIADAINSIMANNEHLELYKNNIAKIKCLYSWDNEEKILLDLYKSLNLQGKTK